jgi:hypothetical protein
MLGNAPFGFGLLRIYTALMGSCVDNIYIERSLSPDYTPDPTKNELLKVPVEYSCKDKMLTRLMSDPDIDRPYSALLPRIAFEMLDMVYDGDRKQPSMNYTTYVNSDGIPLQQYVPVPYNLYFNVYVMAKNALDGAKIIEQITPFFTPEFTFAVTLIPEMNDTRNIPIVLKKVTCEDKYDGQFTVRRSLIWTLQFVMKGFLYGPILVPGVIKKILFNFDVPVGSNADLPLIDVVGNTAVSESLTVQVAMLANGSPTNDARLSVPYQSIVITDDYGFSAYITGYSSGGNNDEQPFE